MSVLDHCGDDLGGLANGDSDCRSMDRDEFGSVGWVVVLDVLLEVESEHDMSFRVWNLKSEFRGLSVESVLNGYRFSRWSQGYILGRERVVASQSLVGDCRIDRAGEPVFASFSLFEAQVGD